MSVLNTHIQQPAEFKRYQLSYARWLDSSQDEQLKLVATTVTALNADESPAELVVNVSQFIKDNTVLEYVVTEGTDGVEYDVEFTMTSTLDQVTQDKVRFRIIDL